jgi:hypothetical protein
MAHYITLAVTFGIAAIVMAELDTAIRGCREKGVDSRDKPGMTCAHLANVLT